MIRRAASSPILNVLAVVSSVATLTAIAWHHREAPRWARPVLKAEACKPCPSCPVEPPPPVDAGVRVAWAPPLPATEDDGRSLAEREVRLAPGTARLGAERVCRDQGHDVGNEGIVTLSDGSKMPFVSCWRKGKYPELLWQIRIKE